MPYSRITRTAYGADAIRYARGHGKGHNGHLSRNLYCAGVNMLPDGAMAFEKQMRPLWDRVDARHKIQVDRYVVLFSPNELDPDNGADQLTALEIRCRIAETNAPDYQSAVFVQSDRKGHKLHLHILTNDVRMNDHKGVEVLEQKQKDGSVTYIHHATRTMLEYYVYELVDISRFQAGDKLPVNLRSRSCKMGTDYSPEGIAKLFQQVQPEMQGKSEIAVDIPGIVASVREPKQQPVGSKPLTPEEKDKLALAHAVELAKRYVEPIVRLIYPDADEEWEDRLYDRFVRWRNARRRKWQAGEIG